MLFRGPGKRRRRGCYSAVVNAPRPESVRIEPARRVVGRLRVPGDKSISHRALLLAAMARGTSRIENLGPGDDCRSTQACLQALGVAVGPDARSPGTVVVEGRGAAGFRPPTGALDAGNSGTTTRLLLGVLAGHAFAVRLVGDASLSRRPMRRIIEPLERMGARISATDGRLPLEILGGRLTAIDYRLPVPSAQVKSGILLAALAADGVTVVREPAQTRDHTERAFTRVGLTIRRDADGALHVPGHQEPAAADVVVPGDPSSAAFWAVAAAALPGSDVHIEGVGLNPTRLGFVALLRRAGAMVDIVDAQDGPEPTGTLRVRHGGLGPVTIAPDEVPGVIDELPALAALATFGGGMSVTGAAELRVKESDRIADLVRGLRALGAEAEEWPDGFRIGAPDRLRGGAADAAGDHRLAMAFALAALGATGPSTIDGAEAVSVSYPGFFTALESLRS